MRAMIIGAAVTAILALSACGNDAKPDDYWVKHQGEAKARIKECKANQIDLGQEIKTKPPEALSSLARECLYLMGGGYQRDLRNGKPTSILD